MLATNVIFVLVSFRFRHMITLLYVIFVYFLGWVWL